MSMLKTILSILLVVSGINSFAQQQFYMYVQAGAAQPFYARIQNRIYSSSENGYMIVPKLHDSTYEVFIGFARNVIPEQHFSINMNKQDQGFELRNFGEKGWGLFNLQNTAVIMNTTPVQQQVVENTGERKNDPFSAMLANVVNDSAILYAAAKPVAALPAKDSAAATTALQQKPVTTPPAEEKKQVSSDTVLTAKTGEKKDAVSTPPPAKMVTADPVGETRADTAARKTPPITEKPFITRISEFKNQEGYHATYIEQYNFSTDTVSIIIPARETNAVTTQSIPPANNEKISESAVVTSANPPITNSEDTAYKKKQPVIVINSDCKNFASVNDVDKLRVKIIAENAVDDKLVVARKYFKSKCYSVKQVRALAELFPGDESKYRFFDTSYPFVSDTDNFASLEELMGNDYYKNRFKAMIHK